MKYDKKCVAIILLRPKHPHMGRLKGTSQAWMIFFRIQGCLFTSERDILSFIELTRLA
jgi:hypothetical protein